MWKQALSRRFTTIKDENISLIRRELLADVFQNILKFGAYSLSHSQAVKAEIMRSVLDAGNHVVLYYANKWSLQNADEAFNFGYGKFKNLAVILPGACFAMSGLYNLFLPFTFLAEGTYDIAGLSMTPISLSAIILSSLGEFYVFYKNVGDVEVNPPQGFLQRVRSRTNIALRVIMGKENLDPIQSAIIVENVLAIMGVSMPIITSVLCYATGAIWFDLVGEMLNGCVQIYLGGIICTENSRILVGRSIQKEDAVAIKQMISKQKGVLGIQDLKTEYLGSQQLKITADVKFDTEDISRSVLKIIDEEIKKVSQDPDKYEAIAKLLMKSSNMVVTHTSQLVKLIEQEIANELPKITQINIEQSKTNILEEHRGVIPLENDDHKST